MRKLNDFGTKKLLTINQFIDQSNSLEDIKEYNSLLSKNPEISDFLDFDIDGFFLSDNKRLFKGFVECRETSSEKRKVAKKDDTLIYFYTKDGVIMIDKDKMTTESTYNDLAIFFDGKLEFN